MLTASVVVCTRDRAGLLSACLASLDEQSLAADQLEIVVVDNGSTDGTPDLLRGWAGGPGRHVAVTEAELGLSRARNRGLAVASGDVVAFLDDDALASPGWAAAHVAAYADRGVVAVGGPIVLSFPDGRPRWAVPELEPWWSALDLGDDDMPFPPPHGPYGANMSVRRRAAVAAGGFDVGLGRRGRSLLSSEEADLSARLWAVGAIVYRAAAVVVHQVTRERLHRRWIVRRGLAQGRTNARRAGPLRGAALRQHARMELEGALRRDGPPLVSWVGGASGRGVVLDDLVRRAGHVTTVAELAWRRTRERASP